MRQRQITRRGAPITNEFPQPTINSFRSKLEELERRIDKIDDKKQLCYLVVNSEDMEVRLAAIDKLGMDQESLTALYYGCRERQENVLQNKILIKLKDFEISELKGDALLFLAQDAEEEVKISAKERLKKLYPSKYIIGCISDRENIEEQIDEVLKVCDITDVKFPIDSYMFGDNKALNDYVKVALEVNAVLSDRLSKRISDIENVEILYNICEQSKDEEVKRAALSKLEYRISELEDGLKGFRILDYIYNNTSKGEIKVAAIKKTKNTQLLVLRFIRSLEEGNQEIADTIFERLESLIDELEPNKGAGEDEFALRLIAENSKNRLASLSAFEKLVLANKCRKNRDLLLVAYMSTNQEAGAVAVKKLECKVEKSQDKKLLSIVAAKSLNARKRARAFQRLDQIGKTSDLIYVDLYGKNNDTKEQSARRLNEYARSLEKNIELVEDNSDLIIISIYGTRNPADRAIEKLAELTKLDEQWLALSLTLVAAFHKDEYIRTQALTKLLEVKYIRQEFVTYLTQIIILGRRDIKSY